MSRFIEMFEYQKAYSNHRRLSRSPRNRNTLLEFNKFVGLPEKTASLYHSVKDAFSTTDEIHQRIIMLSGPNAVTAYHIIRIRRLYETRCDRTDTD